jgi:ankyrin repeat protein
LIINDSRADGLSPLEIAISARDPKMVKYLISKGANVNLETKDSYPPLLYLCYIYSNDSSYDTRHMEVVEHLVTAGANLKYKADNKSLVDYCTGEDAHPKLIRYLKSKGAK